jgi:hypothetical protein
VGETVSDDFPAARFENKSGDHLWAGPANAPVFQVKFDGRIFTNGVEVGQRGEPGEKGDRGPKGEKGDRGEPGPAGPVVRTSIAVCGQTTSCGCPTGTLIVGQTVADRGSSCSVTSDTGSCTYDDSQNQRGPGMCCACLPL